MYTTGTGDDARHLVAARRASVPGAVAVDAAAPLAADVDRTRRRGRVVGHALLLTLKAHEVRLL